MKRRHLLRRLVWTTFVAAVTFAIVWSLRPGPIAVETVAVSRGTLTATVTGEGRTRVKDLFVVSAPVDGQLERIALQAGDAVTVGQVIARIRPVDPRPLDARSRAEARAAVEVARAAIERAEA
ncbi:MAG TPA: biotin/lipoyl-binding protein, partial [Kofleriaceae bacterium]|nr:biotin/lipoyl-binding protein [Kofleriaceae bacterium]